MEDKSVLSFIDSYQWRQPNNLVKQILGSLLDVEATTRTESKIDHSAEIEQIYKCTAKNPHTPSSILHALTKVGSSDVCLYVAENPATDITTLNELASHQASSVRAAVADNAKTPPETIIKLAEDECPDIRYTLAENYDCPIDILQHLVSDENPYVVHRAQKTLCRMNGTNSTHLFPSNSSSYSIKRRANR